jgi:hypothetical protein
MGSAITVAIITFLIFFFTRKDAKKMRSYKKFINSVENVVEAIKEKNITEEEKEKIKEEASVIFEKIKKNPRKYPKGMQLLYVKGTNVQW